MVALYFDHEFLKKFESRGDKSDPIVYDFFNQFLKSIRGVEVYLNLQSIEELQRLINVNELFSIISEINSPIISNFKIDLFDSILFEKGAITKLFFVENCDEERLQNKFSYYFISNSTLKEKAFV